MKMKGGYFTSGEIALWVGSVSMILMSFFAFSSRDCFTLIASLVGVSSLIFIAKGNPLGQFLAIVFSLLYGIISFSFSYYGEMLTYLGMTMPMAAFSLVSWLKNPFNGRKNEVKVNHLGWTECAFMAVVALIVTVAFYFVLDYFKTANMMPSTLSVTTSFLAVYLTFRRSAYYAIAYAANDVVLIVLWILASVKDVSYVSVAVCFATFFANDVYGFVNWKRMERRQRAAK